MKVTASCGAIFSSDRTLRYLLWRSWNPSRPACMFIGVNGSNADENRDDPTVRRCIAFAFSWGCGSLMMTNLFAFVSMDPKAMKAQRAGAVGPSNDFWLQWAFTESEIVVAAWGNHGTFRGRDEQVIAMLPGLQCLGKNTNGTPVHPLYVPHDTKLKEYP